MDRPLVLLVRQFEGQAMSGIRARFGPEGGSIGRADENLLVLVDPDKTISRVQARLHFEDGTWWLQQLGGNPTLCNEQALVAGQRRPLQHGDWLQIGPYRIEALLEPPADAAPHGDGPLLLAEAPELPLPDDAFEPALDIVAPPIDASAPGSRLELEPTRAGAVAASCVPDPRLQQALEALLDCFDPQVLAGQLSAPGVLDNLVPLAHRARLWEHYDLQFEATARQALQAFLDRWQAPGGSGRP